MCFIMKLHIIVFIIIINSEILSLIDSHHDYYEQNPCIVGMCWVTMLMKMMTVMTIHLENEHTDINHNDDEEE